MAKKHGLGKGLEALLYASPVSKTEDKVHSAPSSDSFASVKEASKHISKEEGFSKKGSLLLELDVLTISPGRFQPRREIHQDELESLSQSIRAQGILQPIVVRSIQKDKYEIIAGERRWRAAQLAGLSLIPVILKEVTDEVALAMAIIENIQRENLNALEEAIALDRLAKEFSLTHAQIADSLGKSRVAVTNLMRLLSLTDEVKRLLEKGQIEAGHAKVLLGLRGHEQIRIATMVAHKGLSVRETERLIQRIDDKEPSKSKRRQESDPDIRRLINSLSEKLGAEVDIQHGTQGKGKVVIQYNTLDELEGILEHIK
jgi:ParB family chromosome partitioning protein